MYQTIYTQVQVESPPYPGVPVRTGVYGRQGKPTLVYLFGKFGDAQVGPIYLGWTGIAPLLCGFIAIDETQSSTSHPFVFAAGDCASVVGHPRPKSGVYAVRAGPPLAENLRRVLAGQPPRRHVPQARALYLLSTGRRHAIASWGSLSIEGDWVWRWKDRIDRGFMRGFGGAVQERP